MNGPPGTFPSPEGRKPLDQSGKYVTKEARDTQSQVREAKWSTTTQEYLGWANELADRGKALPFPGIDAQARKVMEMDEQTAPPGFFTPVDELLARFEKHGCRVIMPWNLRSQAVFIEPGDADGLETEHSLPPRYLNVTDDMDETLRKLILADKEYKSLQ